MSENDDTISSPSGDNTPHEIAVVEFAGEPRARDVDVGASLGMSQPRDVRKLINRHRKELEDFGPLTRHRGAKIGKGRPEEGWLLNEEQSLLIASVSEAPNAPAARAMLIRTFVAWRRGHLEPVRFDMKAVGGMVKGILAKQLTEVMPALVREQVAAEIKAQSAVPALDFAETVSAYQMIEMAGVAPQDRQRGTAQMVTGRMLAFCASRQVACLRTPACVNPAQPYRFPYALACEWLMGAAAGLEMIRNQVQRAMAKKARRGRASGQTALVLVPPQPSI